MQALRVQAMTAFATEVHGGAYPSAPYLVEAEAEVAAAFSDWLAGQ
jgi:3-methyl-2-oxobutanoate hydroxymethyltransferase